MSQVNDRGTKKWTAIMLPEHIQALEELWKEDDNKTMPIQDEQQIEDIELKLQCAIHNDLTVSITYFENHDFHETKGKINQINVENNYIVVNDFDRTKIDFNRILDVQID